MRLRTILPIALIANVGSALANPSEDSNAVPGDPTIYTEIGQRVPPVRELGVRTLKALVETAEKDGLNTVHIGGPLYGIGENGSRPAPGLYLMDNNSIYRVR